MSLKLKALGLGMLAVLAMSAVGVMNAGAETKGHFVSAVPHVLLHGTDEVDAPTELVSGEDIIDCHEISYSGTTGEAVTTVEAVTITPSYKKCTRNEVLNTTVDMNGCDYLFTIGKVKANTGDNTVHLVCQGTNTPTITVNAGFGTCEIHITPNQTPGGGVTYTNIANGDITVDVTVKEIHTVYTGGFFACGVANGHTSNAELRGEVVISATDTAGEPKDITATGS